MEQSKWCDGAAEARFQASAPPAAFFAAAGLIPCMKLH